MTAQSTDFRKLRGADATAGSFEFKEVKTLKRALALTICEHQLCFECHTDAEHCEEVREEMQRRLKDAGA